jgi:putative aldouronate transport system permease protein
LEATPQLAQERAPAAPPVTVATAPRARRARRRPAADRIAFDGIAWVVVGGLALFALLPFLILAVNSFASEHAIINEGYRFWPREWSTGAYQLVFENPWKLLRSYGVTIGVTTVGTFVSLLLSSMAAYVLSRRELSSRGTMAFFLYFTQLFNGGLVPYYLLISRNLKLGNSVLVLLLVPMFNVMNILILRNFIQNAIPEALLEAAKIDGASEAGIFFRIVLPLSKPALASIGLFTALGYWNDWWTPMMFVQDERLYTLQYTLYRIISNVNFSAQMVNNVPTMHLPKETLKLAMTVIATGPIVFVYPFVQRYFVKGITLGAVKG